MALAVRGRYVEHDPGPLENTFQEERGPVQGQEEGQQRLTGTVVKLQDSCQVDREIE